MRDDAFARAVSFVERRRVLRPGERVVIAMGGDLRSAALAALVARARTQLGLGAVAVVIVQRRDGLDDDETAESARFARQLGLEVTVEQSDARVVRGALDALVRRGWDRLALADTIEDCAARVLRECVEGRAVRGLCARRRDGVSRPLLESTLQDAEQIATASGFVVCNVPPELASVPSDDERVRDGILPRIRAEFPSADRALLSLSGRCRRAGRDV